jgi:hypothetical protein
MKRMEAEFMATLTTYHGIVRDGKIIIQDANLPNGLEVIVVAPQLPVSLEAQKRLLAAIPQEEWEGRLDEYDQFLKENPAEADFNDLEDEEIVKIVHEVREEYRENK